MRRLTRFPDSMLVLLQVGRRLGAPLASFALAVAVLLPAAGVASAAASPAKCPLSDGASNCVLVISAPASVVTGMAFTVQVAVTTNGTTVARADPCASKVPITLDVYGVGTYTETASAGIASFNVTVPLNDNGTVTIDAYGPNQPAAAPALSTGCTSYYFQPAYWSVMALTIPPTQPIVPCPPGASCTQAYSGTGTAATLFADDGAFSPLFSGSYFTTLGESGLTVGCALSLTPRDPDGVLGYTYAGDDPVTVVFALGPSLVTKGIGLYNVCWNSSVPWTQPSGKRAVPNIVDGTPDGTFTGLLPNCKLGSRGPCVLFRWSCVLFPWSCMFFRRSNQYNAAFIGVLAPWDDPRGYVGY